MSKETKYSKKTTEELLEIREEFYEQLNIGINLADFEELIIELESRTNK